MKLLAVPAALTLGLSAVLSAPVLAQGYQAGDIVIRGGVTNVNPDSDHAGVYVEALGGATPLSVSVDDNTQLGLNLVYFLTNNWAIELLAATPFTHDINIHDPQTIAPDVLGADVDGATLAEVTHLPPTLSANYYFNTQSNFNPYVGVGINYTVFFDEEFKSGPESLGFNDLELDESFGYALQVGADYQLGEHWQLNASVRYIDIETDATFNIGDDIAGSSSVDINPMVYSVMVGYKF